MQNIKITLPDYLRLYSKTIPAYQKLQRVSWMPDKFRETIQQSKHCCYLIENFCSEISMFGLKLFI